VRRHVQKIALKVLLFIVHGPLSLADFTGAGPLVHRHLANARASERLTSDIPYAAYFSAYGEPSPSGLTAYALA
jgi:hypothetical protein